MNRKIENSSLICEKFSTKLKNFKKSTKKLRKKDNMYIRKQANFNKFQ